MSRPAVLCAVRPVFVVLLVGCAVAAHAATVIRIMPPDRSDFAVGQRVDLRVEATGDPADGPPGLRVFLDDVEITARNILDAGRDGVRGAGGTGATDQKLAPHHRAAPAPPHTTNFLMRGHAFRRAGVHTIRARTADGSEQRVTVRVHAWQVTGALAPRARNIIFFLGDGMGAAHRTAARIVSRGMRDGKALTPLAMDTLEVTGLVMTSSLNAFVTDSSPGMSSYSTGSKGNNNQEGVFPDNTPEPFDNPRVEYVGELLRRVRGPGFHVGIVTTADVTDATPAANAVHTANRSAGAGDSRAVLRRAVRERRARPPRGRCAPVSSVRDRGRRAEGRARPCRPVRGRRLSARLDRHGRAGSAGRRARAGTAARPLSQRSHAGGVRQGRRGQGTAGSSRTPGIAAIRISRCSRT